VTDILETMLAEMAEQKLAPPKGEKKPKAEKEQPADGGSEVQLPAEGEMFTAERCDAEYARLKAAVSPDVLKGLTKVERSKLRSDLWRKVKKAQASWNAAEKRRSKAVSL